MRLAVTCLYVALSLLGSVLVILNVGSTPRATPAAAVKQLLASIAWSAAVVYLYLSGVGA